MKVKVKHCLVDLYTCGDAPFIKFIKAITVRCTSCDSMVTGGDCLAIRG